MNQGDVYVHQFPIIMYDRALGPGNGPVLPQSIFRFEMSGFDAAAGEEVRWEMFENPIDQIAFSSGLYNTFNPYGNNNIVFGEHWRDLQGAVRLTMVSGSAVLDTYAIGAVLRTGFDTGHFHYETFAPVPEPASLLLLAAGALALALRWRFRR